MQILGILVLRDDGTYCVMQVGEVIPFNVETLPTPCTQPLKDVLSVRTARVLYAQGIVTIGDAASKTERQLMRIPNFGAKGLYELREALEHLGLSFRSR